MTNTNNNETSFRLISRCAARITDMATQIQRSHTMGVAHGEHDEPWTLAFHQIVDRIYMPIIPASYARKVAAAFKECSHTMNHHQPPEGVDETDWLIVGEYTASGSQAICDYLHIQQPENPTSIEIE